MTYEAPIMLLLDTDTVLDHGRIRRSVADIREKGFDTVCIEFRNCLYDAFDPQGYGAFEAAAREADALGLKVVQIVPSPGQQGVKDRPEERQRWLVEHAAVVSGGRFEAMIEEPGFGGSGATRPRLIGLRQAFLVERNGEETRMIRFADVTGELDWRLELDALPRVVGTCAACPGDGELLLYAEYGVDVLDFDSPSAYAELDRQAAVFAGLPVAGFAMDEFGTGTRAKDVYHAGPHFLAAFRARYGYELTDKLPLLLHEDVEGGAGKVRFDYYNLTMELTYALQKHAREAFARTHGTGLFAGFHHTWWGEGNSGDLWAGNLDYFRLTDNLSGGFVDAQYDAERTMTSMTLLAESIAKYSSTGIPYNMCWDRYPTPEKMDAYHRLLAVRGVRWIAHTYGRSGEFGPGYPEHRTWPLTEACTRLEKEFQRFIGRAVSRPKVAMLYLWESVAGMNDENMHYHRMSMKALLDKLLLRHIEVDVAPSFETAYGKYDTLLVPWPVMLPEAAWNALQSYAAEGGKVIFMGPPANCTTEGRDIREEFEQLTGARVVPYMAGIPYEGEHEYVAWDMWFTDKRIPMRCYPLTLQDGEPIMEAGGRVLGVRKGSVEYFAFELPLTAAFDEVLDRLAAYRELDLPEGMYCKTAYEGEDTAVLTLTGRWDAKLHAAFRFRGNEIDIRDGSIAGIKFRGDRVIAIIGDTGGSVYVNGRPFEGGAD